MNTTTESLVSIVDGKPATSSNIVAERFGKRHGDVLRAIKRLECSPEFIQRNFASNEFVDAIGRKLPCFTITRDGFMFLAMGFTGAEAAQWKESYIAAFNAMEAQIQPAAIPYAVGPHDALNATQAEQLRATLKVACDKLPKAEQGAFMRKGWSKMKSHFGVSYRDIPQREFTEALSLAGRHAAEWEVVEEVKPERRQLLVERGGVTTVVDASHHNLVRTDRVDALRRDFKAMQDAMAEMSHRMRICFGEINASDLIEPLTVNLDQTIIGMPAQRRAA